jgi:hypothetical protein
MTETTTRRGFFSTGAVALAGVSLSTLIEAPPIEAQRKPAIGADLVKEFVGKAHGNLERTMELVAEVPNIVNASWDWGNGDWETALGAASHVGRKDIADFLLANKARKDVFCAAMQGEADIIKASLAVDPGVARLPGPHRITLLFHAGLGGNVEIAKMLKENGAHDDGALHAAVWFGHLPMTKWLLDHDTQDLNVKRRKMTALDLAIKEGHTEIADFLKVRGLEETKG